MCFKTFMSVAKDDGGQYSTMGTLAVSLLDMVKERGTRQPVLRRERGGGRGEGRGG